MTLPIAKGIDATLPEHIPDQYDKFWLWRFVKTKLSLGDTRNATAGSGIVISGTSNEVATISTTALPAATANLSNNNTFTSASLVNTNLSVNITASGVYSIEALIYFYEDTSGANGFQFDFGGGSVLPSRWQASGSGYNAGTSSTIVIPSWNAATSAQSFASIGTSSASPSWVKVTATATWANITSATLIIRAAQNSTNASNPTHLSTSSYLVAQKIG